MAKLITILKQILTELADTNKSFSYSKIQDKVREDQDSSYLHGSVYYRFKTDNKLVYEVQVEYLGGADDLYNDIHNGDGQMVEVIFYTDHPDENGYDKNRFNTTNNPKELFNVMSTVVACLKAAFDENPFKYLVYHASEYKGGEKTQKGSEQRQKLYNYYIKKSFPKSETETHGHYIITTLE